ncbi:hypothetical protein G7Z17_g13468 [Cylindrodendrum hubeiense]|uniref:SRP9 domain-containing protein n=1 Tax=Cylindrodendrum hubeiense TaxID=595255 RepID=A0A9P5GZW7_9HYPO|nr:hypothetical protein G7Z17_g13468 [Cylindrodendrum hubeiense]
MRVTHSLAHYGKSGDVAPAPSFVPSPTKNNPTSSLKPHPAGTPTHQRRADDRNPPTACTAQRGTRHDSNNRPRSSSLSHLHPPAAGPRAYAVMPYFKSSQEWLDQSVALLEARPATTHITTRYSLRAASTRPSGDDGDATAKPPRGVLVIKTYDPVSGATLKYRTTKAAEVSRLTAVGRGIIMVT